jgi:hypothetical protein
MIVIMFLCAKYVMHRYIYGLKGCAWDFENDLIINTYEWPYWEAES